MNRDDPATPTTAFEVTDEDFLADFHHISVYGATEAGGIDRQAGTAEHGAVRAWFRARAEELGMAVTIDGIGNQYATYHWIPDRPSVLVGSHLDSQPLAGHFDGTYGVIAALHAAARINHEVAAYAEVHIEQGRILEREQTTIGAVTQSWYTQKLLVAVRGEQSHTGATIMSDRHDALAASSRIVLFTEDVVEHFEPEEIVTSVGQFTVYPNSPIVVPREVDLVIDLRASKTQDVLDARDTLKRQIADLAAERNIRIDIEDYDIRDIQHYPLDGVELTEKASADAGVSCMRIETMAGHDSVAVNRIAPSVMVFIPSVDGVSHCEREFTTDADMVAGVTAFTQIATRPVTGALDDTDPGEPVADGTSERI